MKILATGDIHLGAGPALGREPGSRLADQSGVLTRILALACDRDVDAILIAGDVLEGPTVTPEQMDVFARFISAAHECELPIVAVSGNGAHDASMRTVNGLAIFNRIPGITVYSRPALHDLGPVQVACMPWVSPARLVASMDGDVDRDRVNQRAAELLVKVASGIADPNIKPTILMLHGSISGASLPAGISTDDLREPVLDVYALLDLGFTGIVASHIHKAQAYADHDRGWNMPPDGVSLNPEVIYTGSPMPLNFGEVSVPHGCWVLDVDREGTRAEFVPIESRPLVQTVFDITDLPTDDEILVEGLYMPTAWPEVSDAIVKVSLTCTQAQQRRLDLPRLRAAILEAGAHSVKIDIDSVREQRSRVDHVTADLDPIAAFDLWLSATGVEAEAAAIARAQMQADLERVGA